MISERQTAPRFTLLTGLLALTVMGLPSVALAEATIGLAASMVDLERLAPGSPTAHSTFDVTDATDVIFDVLSTTSGIGVTLRLPDGSMVDETNIATIGGEAERVDVTPGGTGSLIFPTRQAGHHVTFVIPNPLSGSWTLGLSEPSGSSEEIAVVAQAFLNSSTLVGLTILPSQIVLNQAVTFTLAAYSGSQPITNATVSAQLVSPSGAVQAVTLLDDGQGADATAGDGLYSTAVIPAATGEFTVLATLVGATPGGTAVTRQAAAHFSVVPPSAALLGTVSTRTVDTNSNGLIDELVLDIGVNVLVAGDFLVSATLGASNSARAGIDPCDRAYRFHGGVHSLHC
jgi:hypothetical protein